MGKFIEYPLSEIKVEKVEEGDPKNHILITLLREGWGKGKYNNYYTKEAVKSSVPLSESRRKMFFNHIVGDIEPTERNFQDWCATIKESWTEEGEDKRLRNRARVMVHNDYLLKLCNEAPQEIGCSIEGRGTGKAGEMEGRKGNIIEEVKWINAFNFVDYSGASDLGVQMIEKLTDEEDKNMNINTVAQLKEQYPNLADQMVREIKEEINKDNERGEKVSSLRLEIEERDKTIAEQVENIEKMEKKIDEYETKEKLREKEESEKKTADEVKIKVDKAILEADLPEEAISDLFKNRLYSFRGDDIDAQIKEEIEDRKTVLGLKKENPVKNMGGEKEDPIGKDMKEREKLWKGIFPDEKEENKDKNNE